MTTIVDLDTFLRDLRQSEVLPEKTLKQILGSPEYAGLPGDELAQKLVHDKKLSAFQAATLLRGRGGDLVYGDYRAVRVLHIGGIGYVLLARHKQKAGWFAVKALKQNYMSDQAMVDMFRLESHAMTTLRHENIVRGLHYGPTGNDFGGCFLAMEFVPGPNLGELVALTKVRWKQACDIIMQAARGLAHTHEQHYLHRDVKPGNIIVDKAGITKLVDYGFARYIGPEPIFPMAADRRPGTAAYVAPERLIGDKSHGTPSDIYGLGMTFYFALTGREPFAGRSQKDTLRAQVNDHPGPVSLYNPDVPPEVKEIFVRMTAKKSAERYQSMAEIAVALEPFAERHKVELDLRALLHARSKTHSREDIQALTTPGSVPGSVLSDVDTPSVLTHTSLSGLSHIRKLEEGVRRVADELANQRAENQRLLDRLELYKGDHSKVKKIESALKELQQKAEAWEKERAAMKQEADLAQKTLAELRSRCKELEGTVETYRVQVDKMAGKMRELTSADTLKADDAAAESANEALRSAYEEAGPHEEETLEDVWTDDELFGFLPPDQREES